eukprot:6133884-Pyramimonas_sp.AAC.1
MSGRSATKGTSSTTPAQQQGDSYEPPGGQKQLSPINASNSFAMTRLITPSSVIVTIHALWVVIVGITGP